MRQMPSSVVSALSVALSVPVLMAICGCDGVFGIIHVGPGGKPNSESCKCTCYRATVTLPNRQIAVSADDASQVGTKLDTNLSVLPLGTNSNGDPSIVGLRFPTLGIPKKAHIVSASLQFTASQASTTAITQLHFAAELIDDAAPFTSSKDLASRTTKTAEVIWTISTPWVSGEAGAAEKFTDLAAVVQAIVDRDTWDPNFAIAVLITGTNGRAAYSFDAAPSKGPVLNVTYEEPLEAKTLQACMPNSLNPNKQGTEPIDPTALQGDCSTRVASTLGQLAASCMYADHCDCNYVSDSTVFASVCNDDCTATDLVSNCSNFDPMSGNTQATNVSGGAAVCSPTSTMAAMMFGRSTTCDVKGTATVSASGETPTTDAYGTLEYDTQACIAQSCQVSIQHQLRLKDFTVGNIFSSATFSELAAIGQSLPGYEAEVDANGAGTFPANATASSARGKRDNGDTLSVIASNSDPVTTLFLPQASSPTCQLSGQLVGTVNPEEKRCESSAVVCTDDATVCGTSPDCTGTDQGDGTFLCQCLKLPADSNATVSVDVSGKIVNRPPVALAGADQTVECDQTNAAGIVLDATASYDQDTNQTSFQWLRGSRVGDQVGFQPKIWIQQSYGSQVPYIFRIMDSFGKTSEDSTVVSVVDTTPPSIACGAPATITPNQAPISFKALASDLCDPNVAALVKSFTCYKKGKNGVVSKVQSCVVKLQGDTLTIVDSGGVDDHISWIVNATDQAGNIGKATCEVLVVQK